MKSCEVYVKFAEWLHMAAEGVNKLLSIYVLSLGKVTHTIFLSV